MKKLSDVGEDALIERLVMELSQGEDVLVGPGDDCAVVDIGNPELYQLLKTDSLIESVHYFQGTDPEKVGWKAIARVLSDFAAMGGYPNHLLVTIAMPSDKDLDDLVALYRGMADCAAQFGAVICGGETSSVPLGSAPVISIAGTGSVNRSQLVRRSGGQVGDLVMVTGMLGGSIQGKHLSFTPRIAEAKWLTENFKLNAMMDLSDGIARDLPRLAKVSGCGYLIHSENLPCNAGCDADAALGDGEDYELLFTVSPAEGARLLNRWDLDFSDLPLTVVGELTQDLGAETQGGWEHFS